MSKIKNKVYTFTQVLYKLFQYFTEFYLTAALVSLQIHICKEKKIRSLFKGYCLNVDEL